MDSGADDTIQIHVALRHSLIKGSKSKNGGKVHKGLDIMYGIRGLVKSRFPTTIYFNDYYKKTDWYLNNWP